MADSGLQILYLRRFIAIIDREIEREGGKRKIERNVEAVDKSIARGPILFLAESETD